LGSIETSLPRRYLTAVFVMLPVAGACLAAEPAAGRAGAKAEPPALWATPPRVPPRLWESFEAGTAWKIPAWSGRSELRVVNSKASEGDRSLRVRLDMSYRSKICLFRAERLNLSQHRWIVLDAYAGRDVNLRVAFVTGSRLFHYETPLRRLRRGWNRDISFDLSSGTFRSSRTDWKHISRLELRRIVRQVAIIIDLGRGPRQPMYGPGMLWLDNIRFVSDPALNLDESPPIVVELRERAVHPKDGESSGERGRPDAPAAPKREKQ